VLFLTKKEGISKYYNQFTLQIALKYKISLLKMISWIYKILRMLITGSVQLKNYQLKFFQMIYLHLIKMYNKYPFLWSQNKVYKQDCREITSRSTKGIMIVCNFKKIVTQIYQGRLIIQPSKIEMEMKIFRVHWFIKVCLNSYRMVRWHKLFKEINRILFMGNLTWALFKPLCHLKMRLTIRIY